jgi:transcription elongation GreA/GreB family factor
MSVGSGCIQLGDKVIFTLNLQAPLGKLMAGKQQGDIFEWNSQKIKILNIF